MEKYWDLKRWWNLEIDYNYVIYLENRWISSVTNWVLQELGFNLPPKKKCNSENQVFNHEMEWGTLFSDKPAWLWLKTLESPGFHIEKTSFWNHHISVVDGHHCYPELDPVIRLDFGLDSDRLWKKKQNDLSEMHTTFTLHSLHARGTPPTPYSKIARSCTAWWLWLTCDFDLVSSSSFLSAVSAAAT